MARALLSTVMGAARSPGTNLLRASTFTERLVDGATLGVRQARGRPGGTAACQRVGPAGTPQGMPAAGVLPGDAEGAGDLGLGAAGGKQRAGLHADVFERLAVTQAPGVAAVSGWSHPAMLPGHPVRCHWNARSSVAVVC